jgi:hypothetical protein
MNIYFGINNENGMRSILYSAVIFGLLLTLFEYSRTFNKCQKSVFLFRMPNITTIDTSLCSDIPYQNSLCFAVSTKNCLTEKQLKIFYVIPLVLFVFQVSLVRECFWLSGDHVVFLVHVSWVASMLAVIDILVIVYQSCDYFVFIGKTLWCTGLTLHMMVNYAIYLDR